MLRQATARNRFRYAAAVVKCPAMSRYDGPIEPMTLGNMRQNGVRGLYVTCRHCGHIPPPRSTVDAYPDERSCAIDPF